MSRPVSTDYIVVGKYYDFGEAAQKQKQYSDDVTCIAVVAPIEDWWEVRKHMYEEPYGQPRDPKNGP